MLLGTRAETRAAERRLKSARIPVVKTLDSFRFEAQPSINQPLVRELAHGEFIKERENVLFIGNSGTGKTHLATALAFAACQMGFKTRFFGVTGLVTQLLERREERQLERFFKQLDRLDLLVLDELGYVPFSKLGAELLFEVVSRVYERTSLVVTLIFPSRHGRKCSALSGSPEPLLDRLTHRVHILEANGESFRLKDSMRRQKRQKTEKIA
ncbi:MAG: IS21-like element helper ATPase IstB [Pontiella sp.]